MMGSASRSRAEREAPLRWKRCLAAAIMLAASTSVGSAADPPCFEIYQIASASSPEGSILLNKCTGESWLLVSVNTGGGSLLGWHPIPIDMSPDSEQTPTVQDSSKPGADAAYAD